MKCDERSLQAFIDEELPEQEGEALRAHLAQCRSCRRELARLQLIWLQLQEPVKVETPMELPYLRQQVISRYLSEKWKPSEESGPGFWESQKIAWRPVLEGISYIPGSGQLGQLAKAGRRGLPVLLRGGYAAARIIGGMGRGRK